MVEWFFIYRSQADTYARLAVTVRGWLTNVQSDAMGFETSWMWRAKQ